MEVDLPQNEETEWRLSWDVFIKEVKRVSYIAAPMVVVTVLQYSLQVVSVMMVGHLGQLSLASVAIATSLTNVTGFSLLSGLVGGLETLCGQAYGAKQYHKLGVYTYSAMISLSIVCLPICVLWIYMDKFLELMGQDHSVSVDARKYSIWLIPGLFSGSIQKPLVRYLQTQGLIMPMLVSAFLVFCFHVPVSWAFIFKTDFGKFGAAIGFTLSSWFYVILLVFYVKFSTSCELTRLNFSIEAFRVIGKFFGLGIPAAVMVCLKWWSLEVLVLLSGLLPNPKLQTTILSICLTISTLHFTVPYGIGVAASTRVSNELGAGNPQKARMVVLAVMTLAIGETIIVIATLFGCRKVVGLAYSNQKEVVNYIALMTPLICLSIFTDSLQAVISGIARGCGWQHIGAYINLGAFYLVGIPVSVLLGFHLHLKAKGFWIGIVVGSVVQSSILSLVTAFTDWQKQATEAKKRVSQRKEYPKANHPQKKAPNNEMLHQRA